MLHRLVVMVACFGLLMGCVIQSPTQSALSTKDLTIYEDSSLESWWVFFNDPILDRLILSALNNNDGSDNALAFGVVRKYAQYRYVQNQKNLLEQYIEKRNIKDKSQQIVWLRNKIELENKAIDNSLEITKLSGLLPEYVSQILKEDRGIPASDVTTILASGAFIAFNSPKIIEPSRLFVKNVNGASLRDTRNIFPDITFSRFFGIEDGVYLNDNANWGVSIGNSIKNLDLGELENKYSNDPAYIEFIGNIYDGLVDIERKIISYANMEEQYIVLKNAADDYQGECLSEICDQAYSAALAALRAEYERFNILIDLYEVLTP